MSINDEEVDIGLSSPLLVNDDEIETNDPEVMKTVIPLPSYEDDHIRSEIANDRMNVYNSVDDDDGDDQYSRYIRKENEDEGECLDELLHEKYHDRKERKKKIPPYRPWTEKELLRVPLTRKERLKAHYFIFALNSSMECFTQHTRFTTS